MKTQVCPSPVTCLSSVTRLSPVTCLSPNTCLPPVTCCSLLVRSDSLCVVVQETFGSPEEEQKPQSSISVLRRSFFEGGAGERAAETEWEKRLSSSPLRQLHDSPMIEPLEAEEVKGRAACPTVITCVYFLSVCLTVCLPVCLSVCPFPQAVPLNSSSAAVGLRSCQSN